VRTLKYPISISVSQLGAPSSTDGAPSSPPADENDRRRRRRRRHSSPSFPPEQAALGGASLAALGRRTPVKERLGPRIQSRTAHPKEESISEPPIDAASTEPTAWGTHKASLLVSELAGEEAEASMAAAVNASLNRHFSRVSCIFNSVTHQKTNIFCMKWRGERRKEFHDGETRMRCFPDFGNRVKLH
jgi:hypothetical protein